VSKEVGFLLPSRKFPFERDVLSGEVEQLEHDLPASGDTISPYGSRSSVLWGNRKVYAGKFIRNNFV
jgi:hypothetical protein